MTYDLRGKHPELVKIPRPEDLRTSVLCGSKAWAGVPKGITINPGYFDLIEFMRSEIGEQITARNVNAYRIILNNIGTTGEFYLDLTGAKVNDNISIYQINPMESEPLPSIILGAEARKIEIEDCDLDRLVLTGCQAEELSITNTRVKKLDLRRANLSNVTIRTRDFVTDSYLSDRKGLTNDLQKNLGLTTPLISEEMGKVLRLLPAAIYLG
jgi:hypothetical protein